MDLHIYEDEREDLPRCVHAICEACDELANEEIAASIIFLALHVVANHYRDALAEVAEGRMQ